MVHYLGSRLFADGEVFDSNDDDGEAVLMEDRTWVSSFGKVTRLFAAQLASMLFLSESLSVGGGGGVAGVSRKDKFVVI